MKRSALVLVVALAVVTASAAAPPRAKIGTHSTSLGTVLVAGNGRTVYVFGGGACTGACTATWPPVLTSGKPVGVARLGTRRLAGGKLQVTFAGKPLHYYAADRKPGQIAGASVARWFALTPAGAKVHDTMAPPPGPAPPGGGYGGGDGY